jgi:hypothetical protein
MEKNIQNFVAFKYAKSFTMNLIALRALSRTCFSRFDLRIFIAAEKRTGGQAL